jgi:hypothetical protein
MTILEKREVLKIDELSEEDIELIKNARVPEKYYYLDHLMSAEQNKK